MTNIVRTKIDIADVRVGMTIEHEGHMVTVSKGNLPSRGFCGFSFEGDASKQELTRIQFAVPTAFGIVLR